MIESLDRISPLTLQTSEGSFDLGDLKRPVVLFFFPHAFSPLCTKENCSFRDRYEDISGLGADVIGVSQDDETQLAKFRAEYRLPFPTVADPDATVAKQLGAGLFAKFTRRMTLVIDREGMVRLRYVNDLGGAVHSRKAKEALELLAAQN